MQTTNGIPLKNDETKPSHVRAELQKAQNELTLIDDLLAGPARMLERASAYIKSWPNERPEVYLMRRTADTCFGGLQRTVNAGVGMVWGKEPSVNWGRAEDRMKALWDNIDATGTKGTVLGAQFMRNALAHGCALLHIDHPPQPVDADNNQIVVHSGNEEQYNMRPVVSMHTRQQILSWRCEPVNNVETLVQLVLKETPGKNSGDYGVSSVTKYRVLRLVNDVATWELYETISDGATTRFQLEKSGTYVNRVGKKATRLPVAIAYTGYKRAELDVDIPLIGVAYANLGHYRYATELAFNRKLSAYEQLVVSGELKKKRGEASETIEIGPLIALVMAQGGTAQWIGPSGKGLAELRMGMTEKLHEMDQMGLGFLVPQKTVQATATETRIDAYAQLSSLVTTTVAVQDAINMALEWIGWYEGIEKVDCAVLTLNTDFESREMDAGVMNAYVAMVKAGFPRMAVLQALREGKRIPPDADLDKLALEWESAAFAQEELEAEQQRLRQDAAQREDDNTQPKRESQDDDDDSDV